MDGQTQESRELEYAQIADRGGGETGGRDRVRVMIVLKYLVIAWVEEDSWMAEQAIW